MQAVAVPGLPQFDQSVDLASTLAAAVVHVQWPDGSQGIADGDILVCPSTSPPWSPYFAVVAAVVTDAGGVVSHAAIEAREYGIPAVVGTRLGTRRIPDGAMVTVDGSAGTITIEA